MHVLLHRGSTRYKVLLRGERSARVLLRGPRACSAAAHFGRSARIRAGARFLVNELHQPRLLRCRRLPVIVVVVVIQLVEDAHVRRRFHGAASSSATASCHFRPDLVADAPLTSGITARTTIP